MGDSKLKIQTLNVQGIVRNPKVWNIFYKDAKNIMGGNV